MMLISISKPLRAPVDRLYPRRGEPISQLVNEALSRFLRGSLHTLFKVSTSGALVQGVYERAVSSTLLLFYSTTATLGLEPSRTLMARWPYSTEQSTKCGAIATDNPPQRGGSGNSLRRRHFCRKGDSKDRYRPVFFSGLRVGLPCMPEYCRNVDP
jgi:hypothetical protein